MIFLPIGKSDIETLRFQWYFIRPKTAEGNTACRKTNITAKQYNSPKANKTGVVSLRVQRLRSAFFIEVISSLLNH